jgi:hypothetical protein
MWRCPRCLNTNDVPLEIGPYLCSCGALRSTKGKVIVPELTPRLQRRIDAYGNLIPLTDEEMATLLADREARLEREGNIAWMRKHMYRGCEYDWHVEWEKLIPARDCSCRKRYEELKKVLPPRFDSPESYWQWGVELHNLVNLERGVSEISLERARLLWLHEPPANRKPRLVITVAIGREFRALLKLTQPAMEAYAKRCDADFIALDNMTQEWWGLEKFRTWHFAKEYEETLFIDADCIIRHTCPNMFGRKSSIAIHDDYAYLTSTEWLTHQRANVAELSGLNIVDAATCLNTGVVYTRKSAADIWKPPMTNIGQHHCAEQIVVEHRVLQEDYEVLESKLNWQYYFPFFRCYAGDAHIAHLANCPDKLIVAGELLNEDAFKCTH